MVTIHMAHICIPKLEPNYYFGNNKYSLIAPVKHDEKLEMGRNYNTILDWISVY